MSTAEHHTDQPEGGPAEPLARFLFIVTILGVFAYAGAVIFFVL
jgi:hypothetical protein